METLLETGLDTITIYGIPQGSVRGPLLFFLCCVYAATELFFLFILRMALICRNPSFVMKYECEINFRLIACSVSLQSGKTRATKVTFHKQMEKNLPS